MTVVYRVGTLGNFREIYEKDPGKENPKECVGTKNCKKINIFSVIIFVVIIILL